MSDTQCEYPKERRSGSEKRQRGVMNTFRSTRAERAKADRDAAALSFTFGTYIRWLLFEHPQTRPVRRPLPSERLLTQLIGKAGHADGNLAQLLRRANRGEMVSVEEVAEAASAVRDFYRFAVGMLKDGR